MHFGRKIPTASASIFRLPFSHSEDGSTVFQQDAGTFLHGTTTQNAVVMF
jgi:hypothetical protein